MRTAPGTPVSGPDERVMTSTVRPSVDRDRPRRQDTLPPATERRPVPFQWMGPLGGGIGTVVLQANEDATLTVTGRVLHPRDLRKLRLGRRFLAVTTTVLVLALAARVAMAIDAESTSPSIDASSGSMIERVLAGAVLLILIAAAWNVVWNIVVAVSTGCTQVRVPLSQVAGVRTQRDYSSPLACLLVTAVAALLVLVLEAAPDSEFRLGPDPLWLILLLAVLGLFGATISFVLRRRRLWLEVPVVPDGSEPTTRLVVREVAGGRGDAKAMAGWLLGEPE